MFNYGCICWLRAPAALSSNFTRSPGALRSNTPFKVLRFRVLGVVPAPAQGACTITNLYVARFGVPPVGSRIFVSTNETQNGWEGPRLVTSALVPTST